MSYSGCSGCGASVSSAPGYGAVGAPATAVAASGDRAPATLVITLPAEAKLTIDGHTTKATSGQRVFTTPLLEPGKTYEYTLRAEVPVDGKTEVITKVVQMQAGREIKEKLELPTGVASAR